MRRIVPSLRKLADDLGIEGFLILFGVAGLAYWADYEYGGLAPLFVISLAAIIVGFAVSRPMPKE